MSFFSTGQNLHRYIQTALSHDDEVWFSNIPPSTLAVPEEIREVIEWVPRFYEARQPDAVLGTPGLVRSRHFSFASLRQGQALVTGVQTTYVLTS